MMYLTFTATVPRNNTAIICIAFTNNVRLSAPAFLTVRGEWTGSDMCVSQYTNTLDTINKCFYENSLNKASPSDMCYSLTRVNFACKNNNYKPCANCLIA